MTRAFLARPTYGPVDPIAVNALLGAVLSSLGTIEWLGMCTPDRIRYDHARSLIARDVVRRDDADGVLWIDADMVPKVDTFARLVERGLDFVSALYRPRDVWANNDEFWEAEALPGQSFDPKGGLQEVGVLGFGCAWTSNKLLRAAVAACSKGRGPFWFDTNAEDENFCALARHLGFRLYVDASVTVGHLGKARIFE